MEVIDISKLINTYIDKYYREDNSYFFTGGCSTFASALYHTLIPYVNVEYICIANNCHDCVRVDDKYFDADGIFNTLSELMSISCDSCNYYGAIKELKITNHIIIEDTPCNVGLYMYDIDTVNDYVIELQELQKELKWKHT